jgi:hypothetical protein
VALGGAEAAEELDRAQRRLEFCSVPAGAVGLEEWYEIELHAKALHERIGRARLAAGLGQGPIWRALGA